MNIGWILGWAVPDSWFASIARAAMPRDEHRFFSAGPDALVLVESAGPFDWIVGYSLGTLLLLGARLQEPEAPAMGGGTRLEGASTVRTSAARTPVVDTPSSRVSPITDAAFGRVLPRVALLAPIFGFPLEEGLGGKVRRGQLKQLGRQLVRDPIAPVRDFYRFAGLDITDAEIPNLDPAALYWGIEQLDKASVPPPMPAGWRAWCGADDALLDAARLHELDPAVTVIPTATHHPAGLIRAFAQEVGS